MVSAKPPPDSTRIVSGQKLDSGGADQVFYQFTAGFPSFSSAAFALLNGLLPKKPR